MLLVISTYVGMAQGLNVWPFVFAVGSSAALAYLLLGPLSLLDKARKLLLHSSQPVKIGFVAGFFIPILAAISYWISVSGSVENLPVFPAVLAIFYGWILMQAYFVAAPASQVLARIEEKLRGDKFQLKAMRSFGIGLLFLSAVPLLVGVFALAGWLASAYAAAAGAETAIILWVSATTSLIGVTYLMIVRWGWRMIKQNRPESAVFAGGLYLVLWGYLLYRLSMLLIGYLNQQQPTNIVLDTVLLAVAVVGSMYTFAGKILKRAGGSWRLSSIFFTFAFGFVYAVAHLYFILQIPLTRIEVAMMVNSIVSASGILVMMYFIKKHLFETRTHSPSPRIESSRSFQSQDIPSAGGDSTLP